jgi:tetratricopeptide (TPR) repeat protein
MGTTGILSVFSRIYLATSLAELGDFATAMLHAETAYRIAEAARHVYSSTFGCYGIGTIRAIRGEIADSITILEHGLELCRSWNLPVAFPLLSTSLGHAYCLDGRPEEAIGLLEEAERQAGAMARMGGHAMLLVRLGEAYLRALRLDDARRCALLALTLSRQHTERGLEAYALRLLGELRENEAASFEESDALYHEAMVRAEELEMRPLLAQCHLDLGRLHRRAGQRAVADSHANAALTLFQALDMPFWLERTETQLVLTG